MHELEFFFLQTYQKKHSILNKKHTNLFPRNLCFPSPTTLPHPHHVSFISCPSLHHTILIHNRDRSRSFDKHVTSAPIKAAPPFSINVSSLLNTRTEAWGSNVLEPYLNSRELLFVMMCHQHPAGSTLSYYYRQNCPVVRDYFMK